MTLALFRWFIRVLVGLLLLPVVGTALLMPKRRRTLVWGPDPIINNRYWSQAVRSAGWDSLTLMEGVYDRINRTEDFDIYFHEFVPRWACPPRLRPEVAKYLAFRYIVRNANVVHIPFTGGPLGGTPFWRLEAWLLRLSRIRSVVIPYGADCYQYSQVIDPSLRNGLLLSYPGAARREPEISSRVRYWNRHADVVLTGLLVDGMGRWDVVVANPLVIDVGHWEPTRKYSEADGVNGVVKVLHTPNHRGFKGTEFLVAAVETLQRRGLQVELVMLEKVQNAEVRRVIGEVDILVEQLLFGYAMSAIEGMASGLPVLSNLDSEAHTRLHRRFAYLDECPILSTTPETVALNLEILVRNPRLREQLGRAGRAYVEKYHSFETARYLFGSIYEVILHHQDVDLMNLFHPLKSGYNWRRPKVDHPLVESRYQATGVGDNGGQTARPYTGEGRC